MVSGTVRVISIPELSDDQINRISKNYGISLAKISQSSNFGMLECSKVEAESLLKIEEDEHINLWLKPNFDFSQPFLFIFDLDSTLIQFETIDALAEFAGVSDQVKAITKKAMEGELDFEQALRTRSSLLKGLIAEDCWCAIKKNVVYNKGALNIPELLKKLGISSRTAIVSGGFEPIAEHVRKFIGMDFAFANKLKVDDGGAFTGELVGQVITPIEKKNVMDRLAEQYNIPRSNIIAIGDGANDKIMIKSAGVGVAYNAKAALKSCTPYRFDHAGKDLCLLLEALLQK